jgi:hypothetical protein
MFRLTKWYLDCVADGGDTVMLYWASLTWGLLRLHYGSALIRRADGTAREVRTLRPGPAPHTDGEGHLRWACQRLEAHGTWHGCSPSVDRTLLDDPAGFVRWHCLMPRATATVRFGATTITGLGYAELLSMTLPPWRLPCDVLRWGRYVAPDDDAVWIAWQGSTDRTWAFRRGTAQAPADVRDDCVDLGPAHLTISDDRVLRTGPLIQTALRPLRMLVSLLPRWRTATETKWLGRGTLAAPGDSSTGWVIHEAVHWP